MKDKTSYIEMAIYSLIVLLLVAISVTGYQGAQERKAAAAIGYIPNVIGIAVDYLASEPTEVQPPLFGNIVSGTPYKARITNVSMVRYPLPGENMDCMADIQCEDRHSREGYIYKVIYDKYGGKNDMIRWLYWPRQATPPVVEHDLLVVGATNPATANGYYDADGTFAEQTLYKHESLDYYIWYLAGAWHMGPDPGNTGNFDYFNETGLTGGYLDSTYGEPTDTIVSSVAAHDLLLMGATNPEAANGYYDDAGTWDSDGMGTMLTYYKHTSAEYYIYWESGFWMIRTEPPATMGSQLFLRDALYYETPVGAYMADEGTGTVIVYPVNVSVSTTEHRYADVDGDYRIVDTLHNGEPYYKHVSNESYIYWQDADFANIGSILGGAAATLYFQSDRSTFPHSIIGGSWLDTNDPWSDSAAVSMS
jgi:hypothetical protein